MIFIRKGKKFASKQGQSQPHGHSEARVTQLITITITPEKSLWHVDTTTNALQLL